MVGKFIALTMLLAVVQANVPYDTPFSNPHIGFNAVVHKEPGLAFHGHAPVAFAAPIGYAPTIAHGYGGYAAHVGYSGHNLYGGYGHGAGLF